MPIVKKISFLFLFFLLLISCGTREDETETEQYAGLWHWVSTDGGLANIHLTPASTGIKRTLVLTLEAVYNITENVIITSEGTYYVGRAVTNTDHLEKLFLHLSKDKSFIIDNHTSTDLFLTEDVYDGVRHHYSK